MARLLTFRILCAMASEELAAAADYTAWAEAVKHRLVRQGFSYPPTHTITAALDAVAYVTQQRRTAWPARKTR
jgi:hypothetical protein